MKSTLDILKEARSLVEKGWCHGGYQNGARFCTVGAICRAAGVRHASLPVNFDAPIRRAIGQAFIVQWNDAPERTQADVLAAFDKAIAAERGGGDVSPSEGDVM